MLRTADSTLDVSRSPPRLVTAHALDELRGIDGITLYGPAEAAGRSPLIAFNVAGRNPLELAEGLNDAGVESRAGCHCATLAHRALGLDPPASCRLSFYLYNTLDDAALAVGALRRVLRAPRTVIA
jgi:cysteine desulfurase/selenocysteine lyase